MEPAFETTELKTCSSGKSLESCFTTQKQKSRVGGRDPPLEAALLQGVASLPTRVPEHTDPVMGGSPGDVSENPVT